MGKRSDTIVIIIFFFFWKLIQLGKLVLQMLFDVEILTIIIIIISDTPHRRVADARLKRTRKTHAFHLDLGMVDKKNCNRVAG